MSDRSAWNELVRWAEYGESEQNGRPNDVIETLATDAEAEIRADELEKVLAWLEGEMRAAYARRSYVMSNTYANAARRLRAGMHRTGKASS